ncbi:MAG: Rieske 2Fe-2S domain-containing protein [Acinetobacter populi]|jgi:vanillate O-demethylase monooxygenase subunit|uniref:Rieske 2Fe-2S domain-containing protein n=1 Tax=Acinetobacter populi TaxID=1582270 RepID=UPI0023546CC1|nr:Rieske 2Fe-2S domain-containing protein [Acinetobacter populi]MCH4247287.1 Rieske 2Fe-2S domain-containing protein [Acinetobacter populi]
MNISIATHNLSLPDHCSFMPQDWDLLAKYWYPVARIEDIQNAPVKAMLLDEPLVIYRIADEIVVAKDVCPHRGVPLTLGKHDGEGVVCPYHGLRFGSQGRCNRIPSSPDQPIPNKLNLLTYPVVLRYGLVWTSLQSTEDAVPHMPLWDEDQVQRVVCPPVDIHAFAGRQVEGFLDVAHFAWVHTGTFADPNNQLVPAYTPQETAYGFMADYYSTVGDYPASDDFKKEEDFSVLRHFELHVPFTATLTIHLRNGARMVIMNAASPVSARETRLFAPIVKNYDLQDDEQEIIDYNLKIFEEDRLMVETQKPERLPLDLTLEAHIPADRSSIMLRRCLKKAGFGDFFLV